MSEPPVVDSVLLRSKVRTEFAVPFRRETYRSGPGRPWFARVLYGMSGLVVMLWLVAAGALNVVVPQLEKVIEHRAASFMPDEASSVQALIRMGDQFGEQGTNNYAYLLLEGQSRLGPDAHRYYDALLERLLQDKQHVVWALNLWGDPLFASANESSDGEAAYVLINLTGNLGTAQSLQSTQAVRAAITAFPPPSGVTAHLTGPGPVVSDELMTIGGSVLRLIIVCTVLVIIIMTIAYRSLITAMMPLIPVGISLWVSRPVVAYLSEHGVISISTFASSLLAVIVFGAGADYGIFLLGRYQEARRAGEDPESAYYTAVTGVGHIILASGLTVAGATACMSFTRLAMFSTSGLPCTIAVLITVAAALTLGPAVLAVGSRFGLFEPKEQKSLRRWRRIGTIVTRWPVPVFVASMTVLIIAILAVPTFATGYNERANQPADGPSNLGFAAADRHLPRHILEPNLLVIEADHDMRNPADLIALAKLTNAIAAIPGIAGVQSITRPLMQPIEQGTLTNQFGYIGNRIDQMTNLLNDRVADLKELSGRLGELNLMIRGLDQALGSGKLSLGQINSNTQQLQSQLGEVTDKLHFIRDTAAPAKEFMSAIPNCANTDICLAMNKAFSLFDTVDQFDGIVAGLRTGGDTAAQALPQLSTQLESLKGFVSQLRGVIEPLQGSLDVVLPQASQITQFTREVSDSFAQADPSQFYFLPSQAFESPLFQAGMRLLFSKDGKVTRMLAFGEDEAFSQAGIDYSTQMVPAALTAIKGTSLAGSTMSIGGVGGTFINIAAFAKEDFLTSAVAAFAFVFCVILILLRSLVAAIAVIGTVALSFLGALGATVLIWQHLLGEPLNWVVAPMAFTFLVAVGADYNLLLAARFRDEATAGIKTGIIRAMGNTGSVVTVAGLVFGLTMLAMLSNPALDIRQVGTMVGIGLLLDTLLVRSFIVPAIATLLGRWFWWPLIVHTRDP